MALRFLSPDLVPHGGPPRSVSGSRRRFGAGSPGADRVASLAGGDGSRRRAVAQLVANAATGAVLEAANRSSVGSRKSMASAFSVRSAFSVLSAASVLSVASAGSVGSVGSFLSIGSAGSILSVNSAGSILSFCSSGSVLGVFDAGHLPSRRTATDSAADEAANVARLSGLLAVAALLASVRPRAA